MVTATNIGSVNVASTNSLIFTILRNGIAWTGIDSVTIGFRNTRTGDTFERLATVTDDDEGTWTYTLTEEDLIVTGDWRLSVTVVKDADTITYPGRLTLGVTSQPD